MGWLSDFVSNPIGTLADTVSNVVSDPLGSIDRATRGVGDTLEQAAPAILAAVAMYYGIPASSVGAAEIAGAAEAGAITAADVAVATPYIDAGAVTGTALDAGAAGATVGGGLDAAATAAANAAGNYTAGIAGAMTGGDAASKSLIQQLATYTGLSTSAIERLGGAAISSLASMYGAGKLGQASMDAANRLAASNQTATQLQSRMYEDQVARQQPFYQAGLNALPEYTKGVMPGGNLVRPFAESDFKTDPGYGFRVSEGLKALDRTAASRGGLLSGATLKGAERFNQDTASQEYNNAYNRYVGNQATQRNALAGLTGFAPTAAQQIGNAGSNYATNVNNLATNTATNYANADLTSAAARQSAYTGAGGAFANALSPNPLNAYLNKQLGLA
jgi:hypothetical protein